MRIFRLEFFVIFFGIVFGSFGLRIVILGVIFGVMMLYFILFFFRILVVEILFLVLFVEGIVMRGVFSFGMGFGFEKWLMKVIFLKMSLGVL